jgi:predicted Fe-S protein YdhL (DUF1289 family)
MKCARTVCQAEGRLRNTQNGQLYCPRCARKINEFIEWKDVTQDANNSSPIGDLHSVSPESPL